MKRRTKIRRLASLCFAFALSAGCYSGAEEEGKEPPPGYPGGWCLETLTCYEAAWICDKEGLYCYNYEDPCEGVHCGWHGACVVDQETRKPECVCEAGYSNEMYSLYCAGPAGVTGAGTF
ncbi:MAG: hypothetical protein KC420_09315 [Myxococcales bacterium]|nr:hypothetical protein [Myxococcales bacterium]MCB9703516.1 hypothetical protein [Myxococcales bacterium]